MNIKALRKKLNHIYAEFDAKARDFKTGAACRPGCAFCCTHFGKVDVTTLEGLMIHRWIEALGKRKRSVIRGKVEENGSLKKSGAPAVCPFLTPERTCMIYSSRPFSCRQLYSMKECTGAGPTVHRQAVELAGQTVKKLQHLDETGYSGHISYILTLLDKPEFRKLYTSGGFDPAAILPFGKAHALVINRMVV